MPDGSQFGDPRANMLVNLPNIITFARLCAVPVAVGLVLYQRPLVAFWLFAAAGLSDALDGWLARRRGITLIGAILDPVADKALLVSMYVTLAFVQALPDWLAILVVFRDISIVGGVLVLTMTGHPVAIQPLWISKLNTTLQILLVGVTLLRTAMPMVPDGLVGLLVALVTITTFASGTAYIWNTVRTP